MNWIGCIQEAVNFIENHLNEPIAVEQVANAVYYSPSHFQQVFSAVTGFSCGEYLRLRRLTQAAQELLQGEPSVTDLALRFGYESPEAFSKAFKRQFGVAPSAFRRADTGFRPFRRLSINLSITGGFDMQYKLIPDVPRVAQFIGGESYLTSFIGALYAALRGLGQGQTYPELLALSGAFCRLCWKPGSWDFGHEDIAHCEADPFGIQRRALAAGGWRGEMRRATPQQHDDERIRADFVASIDRGAPVLARGLMGETGCNDYCVICGYENGGERVMGWNYYQGENGFPEDKPFVKGDWPRVILGDYVLLMERIPRKPERDLALEGFRAACNHARVSRIRDRVTGFAAWEALLSQLENDDFSHLPLQPQEGELVPPDNVQYVSYRFIIYCDALCQVQERVVVLPYLEGLAQRIPEWREELLEAVEAWRDCGSYGGYLWGQGLSFSEEGYRAFRDPAVRRKLAAEGRRCMERERDAIRCLERILEREERR